jgi:hypothetical protein
VLLKFFVVRPEENAHLIATVEIANSGTATWPVLALPADTPATVFLAVEWRDAAALQYSPPLAIERHALPRDVPVGESVRVSLDLTPPRDVAASTATVFVRQGDGSAAMTAVSPRLLRVPFSDAMGRFMPGPAS